MSIIRDGLQSADLDVPVTAPTLNLDFANSQSLDPRITFTRGSIGTFVNKNGLIETADTNQPRFDYDPISGECKGLLIEESRANLLTSSNSFGSGDTNYGITASAAVSPDGTTNASLIFEKTTLSFKLYTQNITAVIGTTYCGSVFVKYSGSKLYGRLKVGVNNTIIINLINGSILSSTGTCGVIPYPNGWYRIYVVWTATTTSEGAQIFLMDRTGSNSLYQGDGSSGFYIYGMQVEAGAFPTSYIPTTASTVTRSADLASMTGTNFSSWFNQSEGTIFVAARRGYGGNFSGYPNLYAINDGTANNRYLVYGVDASTEFTNYGIIKGGILQTVYAFVNLSTTNLFKSIHTFSTNNSKFCVNGTLTATDNSVLLPTVDRMNIGSSNGFANPWNGTISRLTYYPKTLSPSQLQYITS
jgi:hypothetical protein